MPFMDVGIRDFKAKLGRDSGLKVRTRCGMSKISIGITGLSEIKFEITGTLLGTLSMDNRQFLLRNNNMVENLKVTCFYLVNRL